LVSVLGLICLLVLFRFWPLQIFIALFLGMLVAPPIFVFATGKEILLISISKKSITFEPEFR